MTQIGFTREQAHEALDDFLNGDRMERWIAEGDSLESDALAYIVPAEAHAEMSKGYSAWLGMQEIREEEIAEPEGYKPFRHSPLAMGGERMLPTEPLKESLARFFYGKPFAECDETGQAKVQGAAVMSVLDITLDSDGHGAVPILALGHDHAEPGRGMRWQLAFTTGVRGLYVRITANGFFGEEWGIVTGSGYRLASGWFDREVAERACDALGRVLPDTDWMQLGPRSFTPAALKAVAAVVKRYHQLGLNEDVPEAEPIKAEAAQPVKP
jgi:hypothetical protein